MFVSSSSVAVSLLKKEQLLLIERKDFFEKTHSSVLMVIQKKEKVFLKRDETHVLLCAHLAKTMCMYASTKKELIVKWYRESCIEKHFSYHKDSEEMFLRHLEGRMASALTYFQTPSMVLNGQTPLDKMAESVEILLTHKTTHVSEEWLENAKHYLTRMMCYAFIQHVADPHKYTAHHFQHSLNTYERMRQLEEVFPECLQWIQRKYGLSLEQAQFVTGALCLWHDIGYPFVGHLSKPNHALEGAKRVQQQLKVFFESLLGDAGVRFQYLWLDFVQALKCHCADHVDDAYAVKIHTDCSTLLTHPHFVEDVLKATSQKSPRSAVEGEKLLEIQTCTGVDTVVLRKAVIASGCEHHGVEIHPVSEEPWPGRSLDVSSLKDGRIALPSHKASLEENPLFAVRLADNLDVTHHRFSELQNHPAYIATAKLLGDGQTVSRIFRTLEKAVRSEEVFLSSTWFKYLEDLKEATDERSNKMWDLLEGKEVPLNWVEAKSMWHRAAVQTVIHLLGIVDDAQIYDAQVAVAGLHSGDLAYKGSSYVLSSVRMRRVGNRIEISFVQDPSLVHALGDVSDAGVDVLTYQQARAEEAFAHVDAEGMEWGFQTI
jgi:hypothetical protein